MESDLKFNVYQSKKKKNFKNKNKFKMENSVIR